MNPTEMNNQLKHPLHILIVEDSTDDVELIMLQLQHDGLDVDYKRVENEADFLSALAWTPEVILSDYSLPRFSGSRALQIIQEKKLQIPFILVSGASNEEMIAQAFKQGADDYIMKDRPARLGTAIRHALEEKRLLAEKIQADEALKQSQQAFENLINTVDGIVWEADANTFQFHFVSPQAEKLLGYPAEQWLNDPTFWKDHIHPEDQSWAVNYCVSCTKDKLAHQFDYRMIAEDGRVVWLRDIVSVILENNEPSLLRGFMVDITERKKADEALRMSEERYRGIFENANVAIWEEDFTQVCTSINELKNSGVTDFRQYFEEHPGFLEDAAKNISIMDANESMLKLFGASQKSDVLVSLDKIMSPEYLKEELIALANGQTYYEREIISNNLQGEEIALLMSISYFKDSDNRSKGLICTTDITARKRAEENLRKAEIQYRTLAEKIPPIVYTSSPDQHIGVTYVSPRIASLGFTQEEWIADSELWFRQIHPDDQETVTKIIEEIKVSNRPFKAEYRIHTRDGRLLWFYDEAVDIIDDDGKLLYRQGFMLDITERKIAEQAIHISEERYHDIFENVNIAIWEEDFTEAKHAIDELTLTGITDFRRYFNENPEFLQKALQQIRVVDVNESMMRLYRVSQKADVLTSLDKFMTPENIIDELVALAEGQTYFEREIQDKTLDGQDLVLLASITFFKDVNDRWKALVCTTDITARVKAEEQIQEKETQIRTLTDNLPDGYMYQIDFGEHGELRKFNYVSAGIEKIHNTTVEDVLTNSQVLNKYLIDKELADVYKLENAALQSMTNFKAEIHFMREDLSECWLLLNSTPRKLPNDHIVFDGVALDITERKLAEEKLRQAELKYRTLAEEIPPIVYITGPDQLLGVIYISPRISILGFSQDEWISQPELWLRQIHPDDHEMVINAIENVKENNKPFREEYRIFTRDDKVLWFFDEAVDIRDDEGNLLYRQGYMLDITERKLAEQALTEREKFLALLNELTSSILTSDDANSVLHYIAIKMADFFNADDCYITRWDEDRQLTIPAITTSKVRSPYTSPKEYILKSEVNLTTSVLNAGQAIGVDDVFNSPYIGMEVASRYPATSALAAPLIVNEIKLGAVIIAHNTPHHFTPEEIERAQHAANQISLALWNFLQNKEIQSRLKESNVLTSISRALSETERGGIEKVLQLIVDSVLELIQEADESVIHLLDADGQTLTPKAISGFHPQEKDSDRSDRSNLNLGEGVAGYVIHAGSTINVGDINNNPLFVIKETIPSFNSLLVSPVQSGEKPIGTISVQSDKLHAFSAWDEELLNALSIQAAIAIENSRLFQNTEQHLKEVNSLYSISRGLASSLDTDKLIKDVVNLLGTNFGYYHTQFFMLDEITGDLILKSASGEMADRIEQNHQIPKGMGITGHVVETAEPYFINNVNDVVFFYRNPFLPDTQSEMAIPVIVNNLVTGVLDVQQKSPNRLTENDLQLMIAVADQLAVALQKAKIHTDLEHALQLEQSMRSQLVQSERLAVVGKLLASVSHELNNPLQAIQNALFLIKDEENLSAQGKQDLGVILSEAERMAALIDRLRSSYRPSIISNLNPINVNVIIEDVQILIATHLRHIEILLEYNPSPELPIVLGSSDQLRQVMLNLFMNAAEAIGREGRIQVWTECLPQQNEVCITIKDTGPGIDEDILPHVFEPFITNKLSGTGLGLTITRDIINQHQGRIEVENAKEGGAVFKVYLPTEVQENE